MSLDPLHIPRDGTEPIPADIHDEQTRRYDSTTGSWGQPADPTPGNRQDGTR
jgi:hypothetical protein